MSGKYGDKKAYILQKIPSVAFIPCLAHSLTMVGKEAANTCPKTVNFFNSIEK